jgi:hypothetical protein
MSKKMWLSKILIISLEITKIKERYNKNKSQIFMINSLKLNKI